MGNLVSVVPLLYWIFHDTLFDVIADHRPGQYAESQRLNTLIDILGGLLQIEPYVRDLMIARQTETTNGGRQCVFDFCVHIVIITRLPLAVNTTCV